LWLKAASVGSLWASMEIVLGSFLHNLHVPLAGLILSAWAVCLLVASHRLRPQKGLFLRTGLICAAMKSISPSAVILGPMVAILIEALCLEAAVRLLGPNILGYVLGGALAVSWSLLHKVGRLLIVYGPNLVDLYMRLYQLAANQLGLDPSQHGFWRLVSGLVALYLLSGIGAALLGQYIGARALDLPAGPLVISLPSGRRFEGRKVDPGQAFHKGLLIFHLVIISGGLWFLGRLPLMISAALVSLYVLLVSLRYRQGVRYLKRPGFWIALAAIIILAGLFLGHINNAGHGWSWQGARAGLEMNIRAVLVVTGFAALGVELRNPDSRVWMENHGFRQLYLALPVAFDVLPFMVDRLCAARRRLFTRPVKTVAGIIRQVDSYSIGIQARCPSRPPTLIVTGKRGAGKTTFLAQAVKALRAAGLSVGGILAIGLWKGGIRSGFDIVDLLTGERQVLCRRGKKGDLPGFGPFCFCEQGLAVGRRALSPEQVRRADLVVVDEVGPWELQSQGWARSLDILLQNVNTPMVWVVREGIVERVRRRWALEEAPVFEVTAEGKVEDLTREILSFSQKGTSCINGLS